MPGFSGPHANGEYRLPKQRIGAGHDLAALKQGFDIVLDQDECVGLLP